MKPVRFRSIRPLASLRVDISRHDAQRITTGVIGIPLTPRETTVGVLVSPPLTTLTRLPSRLSPRGGRETVEEEAL